jgi:hypothetical protein
MFTVYLKAIDEVDLIVVQILNIRDFCGEKLRILYNIV